MQVFPYATIDGLYSYMQDVIYYALHGALAPSPLFLVIYFVITAFLTLLSVSCYLHRSATHRAVDFAKPIEVFFRTILWLFTGTYTRGWVAVHRKHHAFTDMPEDPHSPKNLGLRTVLLRGADIYKNAYLAQETIDQYAADFPIDWFERNIFGSHALRGRLDIGITLSLVVEVFLFGVPGIVIWAGQMLVIPIIAAGFINGITHVFGYQRYRDNEVDVYGRTLKRIGDARNVPAYGIAVGEEFHNNHHAYPERYKFSHAWYEFDLAGTVIELLMWLKLAKVPEYRKTV